MATNSISMKKWVDITSGQMSAGVGDRELILRVVTTNDKLTSDTLYECEDVNQVNELFGGSSATEAVIAAKYFGYISATATKPAKISFWRPGYFTVKTAYNAKGNEVNFDTLVAYKQGDSIAQGVKIMDDYATTLKKMSSTSDNFGTIIFVGGYKVTTEQVESGESQTKLEATSEPVILERETEGLTDIAYAFSANSIASWIGAENRRFRYALHIGLDKLAVQTGSLSWSKVEGAEAYLKRITAKGVTAVVDDAHVNGTTSYPEWFTCALLAATKYARANSTIIQEFKSPDGGITVTCDCDDLYNILAELNVNFFGVTQRAGKQIAMYMKGYDLDGTDTAVGDNEMWLKDRIVSEVFNNLLKSNKIPANTVGLAQIKSAIVGVISEAINNGAIQPEKELSDSDRAAIIANTGATDAPNQIYTNGYFLQVEFADPELVGKGKLRKVNYILYYSTGEGIRKVEGSHVMV